MIYLDNNAHTIIDPVVLQVMQEIYASSIGNPSSIHHYGRRAKNLLNKARSEIADFFHVRENELIFTSGATEGLNMVIQGFRPRGHIITSSLEHPAVLEPLKRKEKCGSSITILHPQASRGAIDVDQIERALTHETNLIVLMAANNETGVKTDIEAIAALALERNIFFIVDGVALLGKEAFSIPSGVSAMCFSGHKIHGPLGVGLSIVRKGFPFEPLILGGVQQQGRRGGTENVPAICGFAKALTLLGDTLERAENHMRELRDYFERALTESLEAVSIVGKDERRVSNTSSICFSGQDAETLLIQLDLEGVSASAGSACSSGGLEPSHVLLNMGFTYEEARSVIRFSLSRFSTKEEIDQTISILKDHARRKLSAPLQEQVQVPS